MTTTTTRPRYRCPNCGDLTMPAPPTAREHGNRTVTCTECRWPIRVAVGGAS